ncbi:hypothetical protein VNI00_013942 [Paramarasmius palmivorus]|uniref:Uncharacterized protein n=1 Tax=Paramarasmius palmivorus TaxID=297713 RepID=A0AAW0BXC8_9AGAR
MRQWYSAKLISEKYAEFGWGKPHAFFALMGGFVLYDGNSSHHLWDVDSRSSLLNDPVHQKYRRAEYEIARQIEAEWSSTYKEPLLDEMRHLSIPDGRNSILGSEAYSCLLHFFLAKRFIIVTEEEVQDRSHADMLSKLVALVQTSWFITQCVSRAAAGLSITEVEVIALAFAVLNSITCCFWWHKPFYVRYPMRVTWRRGKDDVEDSVDATKSVPAGFFRTGWVALWEALKANVEHARNPLGSHHWFEEAFKALPLFIFIPLYPVFSVLIKFQEILAGSDDDQGKHLFSSRLDKDPYWLYVVSYLVAILFGAIHCCAWNFDFPTELEAMIWRVASLVVTCLPLFVGIFHTLLDDESPFQWELPFAPRVMVIYQNTNVFECILVVVAMSYVAARLALITIALSALRALSPEAYQTVQWTSYIPHIG